MSLSHPNLILSQPRLMAIVNSTPDSFSDGGLLFQNGKLSLDLAGSRIEALISEGAEILDVGGESTRPGAAAVSLQEELDRVIPIIEWVTQNCDVAISVDTSSPQVMTEAAAAGVHLINDVRSLSRYGALEAVAELDLPVCLMHMQGVPETMQDQPRYGNVVTEVSAFFQQRVTACMDAGISPANIWLDPGFGFGKSLTHNLILLQQLSEFASLGFPVLVGLSRKSMIGKLLNRELPDRLPASLAFAMMALERGAKVLRVHDVAATRDLIDTFVAVNHIKPNNI